MRVYRIVTRSRRSCLLTTPLATQYPASSPGFAHPRSSLVSVSREEARRPASFPTTSSLPSPTHPAQLTCLAPSFLKHFVLNLLISSHCAGLNSLTIASLAAVTSIRVGDVGVAVRWNSQEVRTGFPPADLWRVMGWTVKEVCISVLVSVLVVLWRVVKGGVVGGWGR